MKECLHTGYRVDMMHLLQKGKEWACFMLFNGNVEKLKQDHYKMKMFSIRTAKRKSHRFLLIDMIEELFDKRNGNGKR